MSEIKAITTTTGATYEVVDRFSQWGGNNLLKNIPKAYVSANYNAYQLNLTENLKANETYTVQFWDCNVYHSAKTAAQTGIWIYWGGGSVALPGCSWYGPTYFTAGTNNYHADYLVKTFTVTSSQASGNGATNAWLNLYNSVSNADGTRSMSIGKWKLERGHKATDWSPCYADMFTYSSETINVNI